MVEVQVPSQSARGIPDYMASPAVVVQPPAPECLQFNSILLYEHLMTGCVSRFIYLHVF